jgi:hypothetical protein
MSEFATSDAAVLIIIIFLGLVIIGFALPIVILAPFVILLLAMGSKL